MAYRRAILRRLNEDGIARLHAFLDSLLTRSPEEVPAGILTDAAVSAEVARSAITIEDRAFDRRFEMGRYLHELLAPHDRALREPERDRGLWAWIALYWFEHLCPIDREGRRKPGERARWIPVLEKRRACHRHLVLAPFLVYRAHAADPEKAWILLSDPPFRTRGYLASMIMDRQFMTSPAVLEAATRLYFDRRRKRPKPGSGGAGPGSVARFIDLLNQLDRTYDLWSITGEQLLALLPAEFDAYRRA